MNTKEIIEIINTYGTDEQIQSFYKIFNKIMAMTNDIKKEILNKMQESVMSDEIDTDLETYLDDIKVIKKFVRSIKDTKSNLRYDTSMVQETLIKNFILYLTDYYDCPECYEKLESTESYYHSDDFSSSKSIDTLYCSKCRKRFVHYEIANNINFDKTNIELKYDYFSVLSPFDVIVISNISFCTSRNHDIEDKNALLKIILPDGQIQSMIVALAYCKTCNKYYMLKYHYDQLDGIPICEIVDNTKESSKNQNKDFGDKPSKLNNLGYNVNCVEKLTDIQRHTILALQLESQGMTKSEILSYLQFQINKFSPRVNCQSAVAKWRRDMKFVSDYKIGESEISGKIEKFILRYIV